MKKNIILSLLLLLSLGVATAQTTLKTAYFMDRMTMRHEFNPALMNEYGYLIVPALGDVNIGINSNLTLDKMLYPQADGTFATFLHPSINSGDFLNKLNNNNSIRESLNMALFGFGFHGFGGYNTFDLSLRQNLTFSLPKSLFSFLVGGQDGSSYYMGGTKLNANLWAEMAISHSHRINEHLTIGVKAKYLMGAAHANLEIDRMDFISNNDRIAADVHARGDVAVIAMPLVGGVNDISFDSFDYMNVANNLNNGFGIDLGATYEWKKFNFSLAVTDLGFINWKGASNVSVGDRIDFEGFTDVDLDNLESSLDGQLDKFEDFGTDLDKAELKASGDYKTYLDTNVNLAAEYAVSKWFSAGALWTTTFGPVTTTELTAVGTLSPLRWFDLAFSGTVSSYGNMWGFALCFCPRIINIYIGADSMIQGVNSQYIPYNSSNLNLKLGVSIPIGGLYKAN